MTDTTGLLPALRAVQTEAPTMPKDKTNPHFKSKYTGLDTIVEMIGPLLAKHGLVWTTLPGGTHDQPTLSYRLAHADSGEVLEGTMPLLLDKSSAQALGSALTYARRYSLCAVLNLVTDDDDDGTAAGVRQQQATAPPRAAGNKKASRSEIRRIYEEGEGLPRMQLVNILRKVYGAEPLNISEEDAKVRLEGGMTNLTSDKVSAVMQAIREAKGA